MRIEVKNLVKEYQRGKHGFDAVSDVSFTIEQGEFVCIVGHSGCGKSTLLNMLTGLLKPSSGEIRMDGSDIGTWKDRDLADLRNTTIGYVLQGQGLLPNLTIWDNICLPASLSRKKKGVSEEVFRLLREVGLEDKKDSYPSALSGGEIRRAAIVRAMGNGPEVIIADEPTSSLDPENAKKVMELFKQISRGGTTVIVSTHDMEFLEYADRVFRMKSGKLETEA